jgi:cell division protein FtsL
MTVIDVDLQVAPAPRRAPARPNHRPVPPARPAERPSTRPAAPGTRSGHLRVVRPGERTGRRLTPYGGLVLTAVVFVVMAGLAGAHTLIAQGQIRLDELDAQVRTEQARYQRLRQEVAAAESPERIVAAAESQGMVTPDDLVYLQPDTASEDVEAPVDAADDAGAPASTETSWATVKPMLEAPAP